MHRPNDRMTFINELTINGRVRTLRYPLWVQHNPEHPTRVCVVHHLGHDGQTWVPVRVSAAALAAVVDGCAVQTDGVTVSRAQDGVKPPPQPGAHPSLGEQLRNKLLRGENIGRHDPPAPPVAKRRLTLRTAPTIGHRAESFWRSERLTIATVAAAWFTIGLALGYYFAKYF